MGFFFQRNEKVKLFIFRFFNILFLYGKTQLVEILKQGFQEIRDFVKKKELLTRINLEGVKVPFWETEIVWRSPDKQHEIFIDKHRGKDGNRRWCTQRIILRKMSEISFSSHVVLGVVEYNNKNNDRYVFLDAIDDNKKDFWTVNASYENFGDYGKLCEFGEWSSALKNQEYIEMPDDKYNVLYRNEQENIGIRHVSELPQYINMEETIDKFIDQINRKDFSQPILVPRKITREEIKNINKKINDKRK